MNPKELADKAVETWLQEPDKFYSRMDHDAVLGYLDGVSKRRIGIGSDVIGTILLRMKSELLTNSDLSLVRSMFCSGLCVAGQRLGTSICDPYR